MNTRAFTLALIISLFSMFMVYTYIEDEKSVINQRYGTNTSVVVAKVDIQELELIDDSKVTIQSVPSSFVQPGAFRKIDELENTVATVPILKGEQISKPRVTYPGTGTGLSRQVSAGKRAFAMTITDESAVSRLIKPGDRVDIVAAIDFSAGRKDLQKIMTILQNVYVLSTGMSITNNIPIIGIKTPREIKAMKLSTYSQYNTITLELDPYQVQKLTHVLSYSGRRPTISLRNNNDNEIINIKPTRLFDILGEDAAEARTYFSDQNKQAGQ
ncbi:MAG: Flp pilus assembly protein CpaB [Halobacteriovorax sp.]|nr:Flp pilus assembly protein CpaB [Halobacteriovorax sp.]|tara:strand:+ start:4720 stop:5532 length:813 start_codon:yes stop_codon:yes gene_type:complete